MVKEYGYEYNAVTNEDILSRVGWTGTDKKLWNAYSLRSGRDALKAIAREYPNATVFLPALCCDSMITPFEKYGCKIVFYPLTAELCVDFQTLTNELQQSETQKVLLYYDYFGIKMFQASQLVEVKTKFQDLILIEDITHTLLNDKDSEFYADYTIASLRKWVNVPDGGLLWTKRELNDTSFVEDAQFAQQRLEAQCLRTQYAAVGDEELKSKYRSIFSNISVLLEDNFSPVKMSEYSHQLACDANWESIKRIRQDNEAVLHEIFSKNNVRLINSDINSSGLYVPILVEKRDEIQRKLSAKGIFNTVIWPLRAEQILACPTAKYIAEHMLAVPCDQRYTKEDMIYIGNEIARGIHG